ncbi:MAG: signal peptidase I [Clostridia bacterium]|nr:signal peptidase I [Clostridia bacterium]
MRDNVVTYKKSLYEKYRDDLKSNAIFGIIAASVLTVLVFFVVITNFVFIKVKISGSSMVPTLNSGDVVLVNVYDAPRRGDVIVISGEKENGDWLIKRTIAVGGDTVKIEGGYVYLKKSGETEFIKLSEPYLRGQGITFYPNVANGGDTALKIWEVEEDCIFYLGDNRTASHDSRAQDFGTCKKEQVVGTVSDIAIRLRGINTFFENISQRINDLF